MNSKEPGKDNQAFELKSVIQDPTSNKQQADQLQTRTENSGINSHDTNAAQKVSLTIVDADVEAEKEISCCRRCGLATYKNFCGDNVHSTKECVCCLRSSACEIFHGIPNAWKAVRPAATSVFTVDNLKRKVPILQWLPKYRLAHLQGDLIAGTAVALTVLPQALAYAKIANLSPEQGLYTSFMCCYMYGVFGTSKDLSVGTAAVMSLLTAEFAHSPIPNDPTYAIVLGLFAGIIQVLMGVLHIGFIVDYVSHPVIHAFIQTAVLTIIFSQIDNWLGLTGIPSDFFPKVYWICRKLPETQIWNFLLGLICMIALFLMKKMKMFNCGASKNPSRLMRAFKYTVWLMSTARNAIVVILAAAVAYVLYLDENHPFILTGKIPDGLPPFKPPAFSVSDGNTTYTSSDIFKSIGSGFIVVPIISIVEAIAIAKAFARKNKYKVEPNQELIALGLGNILGSFVGGYPITASFSRSSVNGQSGVRTPAGQFVTATIVVLVVAFLTPLFYYIPDAALASIIIMAVSDMFDYTVLIELWHVKKIDIIPWLVTFCLALIFSVETGIIWGTIVSLAILLFPKARPGMKIQPEPCYTIVTVHQGLLYPSVEYFYDHVMEKVLTDSTEKRDVVLDFLHVADIDSTIAMPCVLEVLNGAEIHQLRQVTSTQEAVEVILAARENRQSDINKTTNPGESHEPMWMDGIYGLNNLSDEAVGLQDGASVDDEGGDDETHPVTAIAADSNQIRKRQLDSPPSYKSRDSVAPTTDCEGTDSHLTGSEESSVVRL